MALDLSGFVAPANTFEGLYQIADTIERRKERKAQIDYRNQKEAEQENWRKLALIQDLTNLDKHQTGSDVANAIGNQQASAILQKNIANAKNMSPMELMSTVQRDMSGLITGMDAIQTELAISDKQLQTLKAQYPDLDISTIAKMHRGDIINRRVKPDGTFVNPLEVGPSQLDLSDPEVLSQFATGNKNLTGAIINPPGAETETVLVGKQGDYTKFEGKLPYYLKPNYDRTKFDAEGFYKGKGLPGFEIKATTIPSDALPASNGQPFTVVDKDVYDRFVSDGKTNVELIAQTRRTFPDYDKFNATEKEYAKRNVLYNQIKSLDQNQLHPTFSTKPPRVTVNTGGKKAAEPIDLSDQNEYPDLGNGYKDVTRLFQGVDVTGLPDGKKLKAEYVHYDPATKKIKYKEYTGSKERETNLTTLFQNIRTNNPGIDMKFLEGLWNPKVVSQSSKPGTPKQSSRPPLSSFVK